MHKHTSFKICGIAVALLMVASVSITRAADDKRPTQVQLRTGAVETLQLDKYDHKHLLFKFKNGKEKREHDLHDVALLQFGADAAETDADSVPDQAHDLMTMNDGRVLKGYLRAISDDKVRFAVADSFAGTASASSVEYPRIDVRSLHLGPAVLDVDRHDYGTSFNLLGDDLEIALARNFANEISAASPVLADSLVNAYVNNLGQRIAAASKRPDLAYTFEVIDSRTVNAFTVGGGKVFIYRGLIEMMGSEAELAGVIAHEVGHIVGKHTAKALTNRLIMAGIVGAGAELVGGDNEKRKAAIEQAGGVIAFLRQAKYSRDDEREADFLAVYNLYSLGYDPAAMNSVFDTLRKVAGDPSEIEVFLQDHPSSKERIENTSAELPKLDRSGLRLDSPEFVAVKERLRSLQYPLLTYSLGPISNVVVASGRATYTITPPAYGTTDYTLLGRFEAAGGSGNDIRVVLLDQDNYLNWSNGHKATVLFDGGRATLTKMSVPIDPAGVYVLVLDNSFSIMTDKRVVGELWVQCRE